MLCGHVHGRTRCISPYVVYLRQASVLVAICNWCAILCNGFVNLAVPFLLYRKACKVPRPAACAAHAAVAVVLAHAPRDRARLRMSLLPHGRRAALRVADEASSH